MDNYNNIIFEKLNGIGTITLNRPKSLNALNSTILTELDSLIDYISKNTGQSKVL